MSIQFLMPCYVVVFHGDYGGLYNNLEVYMFNSNYFREPVRKLKYQ